MSLIVMPLTAGALALGLLMQAAPPASPDAPEPAPGEETAEDEDRGPSLDDLLGLETGPDDAADQAAQQNREELERRLSDEAISDVFMIALEKMELSANLLDIDLDSGLGTQRVQQDVLAKLDQLIDLAKEMSSKQQTSSSSSQSGSGQGSKSKPSPKKTAGEGAQQRADGEQNGEGADAPPGREGDINTMLEETESEWGHLPARLREMLEQAQNGYISGLYRKLTEEYYKRLAEEGSS